VTLQVPCPNCGSRPHTEFTFGGEERPHVTRDAGTDLPRLLLPQNVEGPQRERWFHAFGCRAWFTVTRDSRTNRIG
jgi:heterotetrameric sarcosine oxidase delta subunit